MGKISVIVPIYKVEPYLRQCLDSIVGQTYRDLEIILVDDGSPDNCGAICDEYAQRDDRITVIHKENAGVTVARNDGMKRATGEWIAFMDSDDWWDADYLEKLMEAMGNEKPDIMIGGGTYNEGSHNTIGRSVSEPFTCSDAKDIQALARRVLAPKETVPHLVPKTGIAAAWGKIYNADFLRSNGIRFCPEQRTFDDLAFNFKAFSCARKIMGCPVIGYHYRIVQNSIVHGYNPNKYADYQVFLNDICAENAARAEADRLPDGVLHSLAIHGVGASLRSSLMHPANPNSRQQKIEEYERMKNDPPVKAAIQSPSDEYLMPHQRVLKHLMRLPWFWPVEVCWSLYIKVRDR